MEAQDLASVGSHHPPRPDGDRENDKEGQPQGLMHGRAVVVLSGPYQGLWQGRGLDPDNIWAMVRLAVGNRIVTVSEYCLRPVSQQEFDSHTSKPGESLRAGDLEKHGDRQALRMCKEKGHCVTCSQRSGMRSDKSSLFPFCLMVLGLEPRALTVSSNEPCPQLN